MSDLFTVIAERLAGACPAAQTAVSATSAAEIDSMVLGPVPIIVVVPAAEAWSPPPEAGLQVTVAGRLGFSCIVALTFPAEIGAWSAVRGEIRAALLGWRPDVDEAAGPVEASRGRLLSYSSEAGGRWLHAFDFNLPAQATYGIQ